MLGTAVVVIILPTLSKAPKVNLLKPVRPAQETAKKAEVSAWGGAFKGTPTQAHIKKAQHESKHEEVWYKYSGSPRRKVPPPQNQTWSL